MFGLLPEVLQSWYKNVLSGYHSNISNTSEPSKPSKPSKPPEPSEPSENNNSSWHPQKIDVVDKSTGEIKEKPVYVFKEENLGAKMSIDDKAIGHDGFTILSNQETCKIAMLVESTRAEEVIQSMTLFGDKLDCVKNISMDMSSTYAQVCDRVLPGATQVIDKFHVIKYVYQAVGDVRRKIRKELAASLTPGKKKTEKDKVKLSEIEQLKRVSHAITQTPDKWSQYMEKTVNLVFEKYDDLKKAYQISQNFKQWYDYQNHDKPVKTITKNLYRWYAEAKELKEFEGVIKMVRKHEDEIINFFGNGMTSANAERLNGKIERFVSNNYGVKNKDFILYRIAGYFS